MYSPIDVNCIHNRCKNKVMQKEILDEIAGYIGIQFTYIRMPSFLMDRENLLHTNFNAIYLGIQINEKHLEYTSYLLTDRFAWFVPSPQPLPRWSYIIKIYYFHTWIIWVSTILGISLIWTLKEFLSFRKLQLKSIFIVTRTTFHWFLEQKHSVFLDKLSDCILIFCIFLMTTLMNFFFKCRFTYLLTGVNYEEEINSFEEILSKGLIIGGSQYAIRMINTTPEVADYLVWNFNRCIGRACLYRTAFQKDQAALLLSSVALSAGDIFMDEGTGRSLLHKIAEPTFNIFTVAYFNKGHPLVMLFNKKLFQLREAGITSEIISNYFENIKQVEPSLNTTQSLKLDHIVAPMSIWFIGIFFSLIIFFWEVIYGKNVI
ncbi:hypothetical protein WA026_005537 [Henosepilachna vigintioctopunctata]|uniref:Solute-binding protein family 3/N-terminal domain-containing protein n=1 Tax=Henosepilachna vigintioctopunctata TaxID=420089 RepID=A0AAW1TT31_9CUCU